MKILFCDDEKSIGELAKTLFLESINDFVYANTVSSSKLAFSLGKFDAVIVDLGWDRPDADGFDIIDHILASKKAKPKIYVTTGNTEKFRTRLEKYASRIDGIFKKPEELLALLKDLAALHSPV